MKVDRAVLSSLAYRHLANLVDGELGNISGEIDAIKEAEVMLYIKRCIAEGKKQIVIQITGTKP